MKVQVLSILNVAEQSGTCPKFNAAQISELESIASDEINTGHVQARAMLFQELGEEYDINIWDDAPGMRAVTLPSNKQQIHLMRLSPNPAKESAVISFRPEEGAAKIAIEIYDSLGRCVENADVTSYKGIYEWVVIPFASGPYIVKLLFDDSVVDTLTLMVQH
jgi:hypothetical protein